MARVFDVVRTVQPGAQVSFPVGTVWVDSFDQECDAHTLAEASQEHQHTLEQTAQAAALAPEPAPPEGGTP